MARKSYGLHATPVDASAYPDDGTSPVGTTEWNEALDDEGMLGFSLQTISSATVRTIASGVATPYDTVTIVTSESSTTDILDKLAITNTSEYDLIYLLANTGHTITLTHTASPSADGHVFTVSEANEVLSTTSPTILMRKGNYWYGYGGGSSTPTDITVADTTDTTCFPALFESATGDLAPKTDAGLAYNAGTGVLTATGFAGALTGNVTGNASGTALTVTQAAQSAITSTGTLTGLTLSGALTGTDVALSGRLKTDKGADVASATAMTLGADGNTFDITGTTTIVTIPSTNWAVGNIVHLQFDGVLTVTHSSATDSILLGDQGNMTTAAGDVLSLFFNGTNWVEISRSSVSSGGGFGAQQFWCDGGAFIPTPSSTAGTASSYAQTRVLSNGVAVSSVVLPKNASIDSRCTVTWTPPENWDAGTIKAKIYWTMQNTTTTSVGDTGAFEVAGVAVSNDDTLNASFGTAVAVTDVFLATNDLHVAAISGAITVGGSPANADFVQIRVNRNAGSDTLENGSNVELLGIILEYTQDASTSSG